MSMQNVGVDENEPSINVDSTLTIVALDNAPSMGAGPCSSETGLLGAVEPSRVKPPLSVEEDDDWASVSKGVFSLGAATFAAPSL